MNQEQASTTSSSSRSTAKRRRQEDRDGSTNINRKKLPNGQMVPHYYEPPSKTYKEMAETVKNQKFQVKSMEKKLKYANEDNMKKDEAIEKEKKVRQDQATIIERLK